MKYLAFIFMLIIFNCIDAKSNQLTEHQLYLRDSTEIFEQRIDSLTKVGEFMKAQYYNTEINLQFSFVNGDYKKEWTQRNQDLKGMQLEKSKSFLRDSSDIYNKELESYTKKIKSGKVKVKEHFLSKAISYSYNLCFHYEIVNGKPNKSWEKRHNFLTSKYEKLFIKLD